MAGSDESSHRAQPSPTLTNDVAVGSGPARRRNLDLTTVDGPPATVRIDRQPEPESNTVSIEGRFGEAGGLKVRYKAQGVVSWVAPLAMIILALAICAAILLPRLILTVTASDGLRIGLAAGAGAVVIVTGLGLIAWLFTKKS